MSACYDSNLDDLFRALWWRRLYYQRLEQKSTLMYKTLADMTPDYLRSRSDVGTPFQYVWLNKSKGKMKNQQLRDTDKKNINSVQSKNRARPMPARLKK